MSDSQSVAGHDGFDNLSEEFIGEIFVQSSFVSDEIEQVLAIGRSALCRPFQEKGWHVDAIWGMQNRLKTEINVIGRVFKEKRWHIDAIRGMQILLLKT